MQRITHVHLQYVRTLVYTHLHAFSKAFAHLAKGVRTQKQTHLHAKANTLTSHT